MAGGVPQATATNSIELDLLSVSSSCVAQLRKADG